MDQWSVNKRYKTGALVSFDDKEYECVVANTGTAPDQFIYPWVLHEPSVLSLNDLETWNVVKQGHGNAQFVTGGIKAEFPRGSYGLSGSIVGGFGFYASPVLHFPSSIVKLSYSVFFDEHFDPVKGGTLPGLFIGNTPSTTRSYTTASCRIMWRPNMCAEAYVCLPQDQQELYPNVPNIIRHKMYGESLWRNTFKFHKGQWNSVEITVKLNTFTDDTPDENGVLHVTLNNVSRMYKHTVFCVDPVTRIQGIVTDTYFGGNDSSYASSRNTYVIFNNFVVNGYKS